MTDVIGSEHPRPKSNTLTPPVIIVEQSEGPDNWPVFTENFDGRLNAHHRQWFASLCEGFGHRGYILQARSNDQLVGLLPLVLVAGPVFGRFLVSLPYLNTGGVWASNPAAMHALVDHACTLADQLDVKYLELRHEVPVDNPRLNFDRTDKFHMRLSLPSTADELMASFKSKLRSQIKKSFQNDLAVEFGRAELLSDFYQVFARNMRDLGTPVYGRKLFASILQHFDGKDEVDAELCVVRLGDRPIAGGLLVHYDKLTEVPSASSLREFNATNANMFMYWHLLERAVQRGSETFDFGRSSEGSGTYKFKAQWGAKPCGAAWQYYVREGDPNDMRPDAGGKQRLVEIWKRLPVWLTKMIGPTVVRGIP